MVGSGVLEGVFMRKICSVLNWLRNKKPHKPVEVAIQSNGVLSGSHYIKDGILYVNNTPVEFEYPAYKSIEMNSIVVVLLDTQPIEVFNENIFCVNSSGEIIWQIQDRPNLKLEKYKQPFTNIWVTDEEILMCVDSVGVNFSVDPLDGSIQFAGFTK